MSERPFRVLSLDGGGIRGLFPAAFLDHIETHSQKKIAEHFDLITGTSTGSIIALGLASGMSAKEILEFYKFYGPKIFSSPRNKVLQLFKPKFDSGPLIDALKEVFGGKILNDLDVPVCIPSYELVTGQPRVLKTDHNVALHWGGTHRVWQVAASSSAAPLYFPSIAVDGTDRHVDGGIWANNPSLVGVVEAIRYFDQDVKNIRVLSIGTGTYAFQVPKAAAMSQGLLGWATDKRIVNAVFDAQSTATHFTTSLLLSGIDQYMRVDANLQSSIPLDNYSKAEPLIEHGRQLARQHKNRIDELFLDAPVMLRPNISDGSCSS